ncbi:MAG: N-acetylneuraminate synthase [Lachnospiraceae bacterium]|nr:N-acetylneuraminate synthase [Lachnospiraceae bacterium]
MERCLIIAEAGVNHNGEVEQALRLCEAAKESGADVVKFQTWITEKLLTTKVAQAAYQIDNTGIVETQFDMLKKLELSQEDFRKIKEYCDEIGLVFASTADEQDSLDFLLDLGIPFIKIGSGEIGNVPYLRYMGTKGVPVILSTGMSGLGEVEQSIQALREGGAKEITLLHCTSNYPCEAVNVNMKAMHTLRNAFRLPVGYSDHTLGAEAAIAAVAYGATVIEKHFTLDRNLPGPDHAASTEPEDFKKMVESIRRTEMMLGDGIKHPTTDEQLVSKVVRKRIVAGREIKSGEIFTEENLCVKRNDSGVGALYWDKVLGKRANRNYNPDEGIDIL